MFRKTISILLILFLWGGICAAQSNNFQTNSNLSASKCDGQLSINLTNNIVATGSTIYFDAHIKNNSKNFFYIVIVNPTTDFAVYLMSHSGNLQKISPDANKHIFDSRGAYKLEAGQTYECSVPLKIGENIEPGDYTLKVTRPILTFDGKNCELESNTLKIKVVK